MRPLSPAELAKRVRKRQRAAFARWLTKPGNRAKHNARARERYRVRKREMVHTKHKAVAIDGLPVVKAATLKAPPRLTTTDASGRIHGEDTRSAEQVIRDYKKRQRAERAKEKRTCKSGGQKSGGQKPNPEH
jgi:hypothetical protein